MKILILRFLNVCLLNQQEFVCFLDLDQLEDAISIASNKSQISIFRSIGNWFRGKHYSFLFRV